jgi:hypothetical protein
MEYTSINGDEIYESEDEKAVFIIDNGTEKMVGSTAEMIRIIFIDDRKCIERTQIMSSKSLGNRKSITLLEKPSLRPISFSDYSEEIQTLKAKYENDRVHISRSDTEEIVNLTNSCYDTFSVELLMRTLPLELGYSLKLHCFNATLVSEVVVNISVIGSEEVLRCPGEYVEAWKVETYFDETLQYYWVDSVNKELLKQSSLIGEGQILEFRR